MLLLPWTNRRPQLSRCHSGSTEVSSVQCPPILTVRYCVTHLRGRPIGAIFLSCFRVIVYWFFFLFAAAAVQILPVMQARPFLQDQDHSKLSSMHLETKTKTKTTGQPISGIYTSNSRPLVLFVFLSLSFTFRQFNAVLLILVTASGGFWFLSAAVQNLHEFTEFTVDQ